MAQDEFLPRVMTSYSVFSDGHAHKVPASRVPSALVAETAVRTLGGLGAIGRVCRPGHGSVEGGVGQTDAFQAKPAP